ncbi:histidine kinase [Azospirillum sp. A39]|uniref:histidine kinase n=1 Tax=Azospirillum sp. A39 TaxID=3462279 RepID=UPI004045F951
MWTAPTRDLKFRLTLRVAAVAAACFAAATAFVLVDGARSARADVEAVAEVVAKDLALQRGKTRWVSVNGRTSSFPDLQPIAAAAMTPGLCVAFRDGSGDVVQRICAGSRSDSATAPRAFAALYVGLFDPGREAVRPVPFGDGGEAVAWIDAATLTAQAWRDAGRLLAVMVATLVLLSGLVYAALARALRPTRLIRAGLERIAANDLSARLPPFDLAELSAVGKVFNHLAESLQRSLDERNALTRRLIALQDDERRHLARELHDEFGQCLAGIRALAASAGQTAARDCPEIGSECASIERTAAHMMDALRGTLLRLRPPDVDDLGLAASLEGLVAGWNGRSGGRTRFEIGFTGDVADLPPAVATGLYRIAQEAITNAAKHAEATRVVLHVTVRGSGPGDPAGPAQEIQLTVTDDGQAGDAGAAIRSGMGLLGMRERVATLNGRLRFEGGRGAGSVLRVAIPVPPSVAGSDGRRAPA